MTRARNVRHGPPGLMRAPLDWRLMRYVPFGIVLLLIPSWATYLTMERDSRDTDHPLYYYIPDLTEEPLSIPRTLLITPIVNTQTDQIILVTVLFVAFGSIVDWRFGWLTAIGLFWWTSSVAALSGGILLHLIHPYLSHIEPIAVGMERIFNGGSAGGFGFMGAFAATARWPWLWVGLFLLWEPGFWFTVSRDYTSTFHFIAFTTGFLTARLFLWDRFLERKRLRASHRIRLTIRERVVEREAR